MVSGFKEKRGRKRPDAAAAALATETFKSLASLTIGIGHGKYMAGFLEFKRPGFTTYSC